MSRAWLLGLILGVPLVGFAVPTAIRAHLSSELRSAAIHQIPRPDPAAVAELTVERLCQSAKVDLADLCDTDASLALMRTASLAAAGAGLVLLAMIILAGNIAQKDRMMLLALFRPGLYVTALVTTGLILVDAVVAIAAVYYGESALLHVVHIRAIALIGFGAVAGVVAVARSAFSISRKAETMAIGKAVTPRDAPRLWQLVQHVARRLGALTPDHIVIGLDPGFFVTEADVITPAGTLRGRTLFWSLPLARILTIEELTAVVGHELGHFRGEDTQFSERFYPIYRGATTAITSLQRSGGQSWGVVAILPAIAIFGFFLERFTIAESRHGRARELLADQAGAEATSPRIMACALVKVHAFAGIWEGLLRAVIKALQEDKIFKNASVMFADAALACAGPAALQNLADTRTSHPTDSHPTLAVRLESLNVDLASVSAEALIVKPAESAASLLSNAESEEEALSETYQMFLGQQLGIEPTTSGEANGPPASTST